DAFLAADDFPGDELLQDGEGDGRVGAGEEAAPVGACGGVAELLFARLLDDAVHGLEGAEGSGCADGIADLNGGGERLLRYDGADFGEALAMREIERIGGFGLRDGE